MKGILFALFTSVFLIGCSTTPNKLREDAPTGMYKSQKEPKEIMLCIADSWENYAVVNTREMRAGYAVSAFLSDGKLRYLADVEKESDITITTLYRWRVIPIGKDAMVVFVESCQ